MPARLTSLRLIALVVTLAAAAGGYWLWHGARTSTAASQSGALTEFRAVDLPAGPRAPGVPAYGVYRYRASGTERAGSGVLSATRALPEEAIYIVRPLAGGYHEDLRFSSEHVEEARYRVDAEGTTALWRRIKVTFLGVGEDVRSGVRPPALDHPATLTVGRRWGGGYVLGESRLRYRARVTGRETATLDGERIPVLVFRVVSTFAGPTPGTRTDVVRWSPDLDLPVAWSITQKTGGRADYAIDADLRLVSGAPLT